MSEFKNKVLFKEIIKNNLNEIKNGINNKAFDFSALNSKRIAILNDEDLYKLAIDFITKELINQANENNKKYF